MEAALAQVRQEFDRTWPLVIGGGEHIAEGRRDTARSPWQTDLVIGHTIRGTKEHARQAVTPPRRRSRAGARCPGKSAQTTCSG
jgi:hypothetical protein